MTNVTPPYKVTKAPTTAPKRVHLLIPCTFTNGPYNGQIRKMSAGEYKLPPDSLKVNFAGYRSGLYRLRPGTTDYVWVAS